MLLPFFVREVNITQCTRHVPVESLLEQVLLNSALPLCAEAWLFVLTVLSHIVCVCVCLYSVLHHVSHALFSQIFSKS